MKKRKKNILEKIPFRSCTNFASISPEAIYSDGLISFKPDNGQKPVRKEMTKWKEH